MGFTDIDVPERLPFGLDRTAGYPLFTPDLVDLMRKLIPAEKQDEIATSVIVTATKSV